MKNVSLHPHYQKTHSLKNGFIKKAILLGRYFFAATIIFIKSSIFFISSSIINSVQIYSAEDYLAFTIIHST